MKKEFVTKGMKRRIALLALVLAMAIPVAALAEAATQTAADPNTTTSNTQTADTGTAVSGRMFGRGGAGECGMGDMGLGYYGVDTSSFTEEQKTAYDSAVSMYEQVEDAVLQDLVTAGVVTQADADACIAQRSARKSLDEIDQTNWTAEQYKAYYEANAKTGDDRKAAMQALADAGQLTQDQADALSSLGQNDLWSKILQNADTNSAIQTALSTLRQARQTMNNSLSDAGITTMGKGGMGFGMGKGGMNGNCPNDGLGMGMQGSGQMNGQNDRSNRMMGKMGGRN